MPRWIEYEDRCYYGQGWEDARNGRDICPYGSGTFARDQWEQGHSEFRPSGKYEEQASR